MGTSIFGPNAVSVMHMAGGDFGTAQTIARIRGLVEQGKKSINVNRAAISIVWGAPQFSEVEKARAIFDWVRANCRFVRMVVGAQTLRSADEILRVRAGDCANLNAVLIPALLETVGIPARLVTISSPSEPQEFTHVYAEAYAGNQWIPMDVARPGAQFGREPEIVARKRVWDLASARYQDVKRLSGYVGLGQTSAQDASSVITAASQGAADILLAAKPTTIGYGTVSTSGVAPGVNTGTYYPTAQPAGSYSAVGAEFLGIPSWVWLLIAGGVAFSALAGSGLRKR
jgi:transglutaminase-like putative cysteine protease